jgi:hypothetical protein
MSSLNDKTDRRGTKVTSYETWLIFSTLSIFLGYVTHDIFASGPVTKFRWKEEQ